MHVSFDDYTFDGEARHLVRAGREIALTPKTFSLLELLLKQRPRALGKAEIRDRLWPGTFVADSSLTNLVTRLRRALQDSARRPRYLRTVQGFGYAFCGVASETQGHAPLSADHAPRFSLRWAGQDVLLQEGENVIGREEGAAARVDSTSVSRRHARILISRARATLEDLGSKNGTFVRGRRIEGPVAVADGEEIFVGRVRLRLRVIGPASSTSTFSKA